MSDERFHIKSDSPAVDDLMFWSIAGHEALSRASYYELTVLSRKSNLNATDILGRAFDVVIDFTDADDGEHERHCQGHAVRFARVNQRGRYFEYRITLRSWFWLLTKRRNSRIFQDKTVVEVMGAVFDDSPIQRFKKLNTDHVIGKHEPRRYCVQHQESDYQFLSRLLEEEGIYYWFDSHDELGTMYLSDASDVAHDKLPVNDTLEFVRGGSGEMRFNEVTRWVSERRFDTGKTVSRDSNFKTIKKKLLTDRDVADDHELAEFEAFEFPGGYFNDADAETISQVRGEELQTRRDRHWALTGWTDVCAGMAFKLDGPDADVPKGEYLIAGCTFFVSHPGYEGIQMPDAPRSLSSVLRQVLVDDAVNAQTLDVLEGLIEESPALQAGTRGARAFLLTVMPLDLLFRPPRLTPRVTMPGPQTAIVVGPAGEEIHADDFGRVKVHFHWDRYDASNEKSTAWIRVSQPWAGKGWGGYFIPRIGQEVIVDFLNGDPDRPIITGRVYNDDQPIPYKSPTQSGFKTRSTPGGGFNHYNELMFEDKKGAENINMHAEKNMSRSVENDDSTSVGHDQTISVKNYQFTNVGKYRSVVVDDGNEDYVVNGHRSTYVQRDDWLTVDGHRTKKVDKGEETEITTGEHKLVVMAGEKNSYVTGDQMTWVSAGYTLSALTGTINIGAALAVTAGEINITSAATRKDISTGQHTIASNDMVKVIAGADIQLLANASIKQLSTTSDTTVLSSNSSGYIGINSEANMGLSRSTFMGLQMGNFLGLAMDNFGGLKLSNCASLGITNTAAIDINMATVGFELAGLKTISPGAGAGAAAAAVAAGVVGLVSAALGASDAIATLQQYADAATALREAAADVGPETPLGLKLSEMAASADRRQRQASPFVEVFAAGVVVAGGAAGKALGGPVAAIVGGLATNDLVGPKSAETIAAERAAASRAAGEEPDQP